jgi:hypothetical protein
MYETKPENPLTPSSCKERLFGDIRSKMMILVVVYDDTSALVYELVLYVVILGKYAILRIL